MSRLLWKMPNWVHELMFKLTGYKPVIELPDDVIMGAKMARDAGIADWRNIETHAVGYRMMRLPR